MHELSIAEALLEQVRRHTPAGQRVLRVHVEAGPLQAIYEQALTWAWEAVTEGTDLEGAKLNYRALPYRLACARCGREWESADPFENCACGGEPACAGSDVLQLISLEVEPREVEEVAGETGFYLAGAGVRGHAARPAVPRSGRHRRGAQRR